ncbi:MAG: cbm32C [Ramlibacter sp.]|jgi:hypothetical protein|nr:cbm32C [Ramlibacter sp.]
MKDRLLKIALLACASGAAMAQMKITPEAYVDQEGIWRGGIVPICWENPENYAQETAWVEESAILHIEGLNREVSSVRFVGKDNQRRPWGKCSDASNGIRITIADQWPSSQVGQQWMRDASGAKIDYGAGKYIQVPTRMVLNFTFGTFPCSPRENCIRIIAVHELLHALGFLHEQLHPNAPQWCKNRWANHKDVMGFKPVMATPQYDQDSLMNYCEDIYNKPLKLSEGDVIALRRFYRPQ